MVCSLSGTVSGPGDQRAAVAMPTKCISAVLVVALTWRRGCGLRQTTMYTRTRSSMSAGRLYDSNEPLSDTLWRLRLDLGREPNTWMPEEWGKSGSRLGLAVDIGFSHELPSSEILQGRDKLPSQAPLAPSSGLEGFLEGVLPKPTRRADRNERDLLGSPACWRKLKILGPASMMTLDRGKVEVPVKAGAYSIREETSNGSIGQMTTKILRFYLDFPEGARKGDVSLPVGERVYFATPIYTAGSFGESQLRRQQEELRAEFDTLSESLQSSVYNRNEESGEVTGLNPLEAMMNAGKIQRLQRLRDEVRRAMAQLPPEETLSRAAGEAGERGVLVANDGICTRLAKESSFSREYHILGKWSLAAVAVKTVAPVTEGKASDETEQAAKTALETWIALQALLSAEKKSN